MIVLAIDQQDPQRCRPCRKRGEGADATSASAEYEQGLAPRAARGLATGPVMVDCCVSNEANCFPMIPSGAAHTDMILYGDSVAGTMDDEAKALV